MLRVLIIRHICFSIGATHIATTFDSPSYSCKKPFTPENIFLSLYPLRARWKTISAGLAIEDGTLRAIEADNKSVEDQLRAMIAFWVRQVSPPPTWSTLADALNIVDQTIAQTVRNDYV